MPPGPRQIALRTVTAYVVVAGTWIALSDVALGCLIEDVATRERASIFKGIAFVVVTGGLLYAMLSHQLRAWRAEADRRERLEAAHASALAIAEAELDDAELGELQGRIAEAADRLADDPHAVELLRDHGAVALENARLRARLKAAIAARDEALAVVAHDLRNPLNTLSLREALLARRERSPAVAEHTQEVQRAIATMDRLIRDLLDANRLERGAIAVHPRPQPLHPLVVDVLETFRPAAESRRIALAHEVPDDLAVHADRDRMLQVMFNLVGNALKFTPDGGQVAVRAARGEREVAVTVADTGAGIPAEDLPHVFERYFTSDGVRGTGLGLFISKEIVAAHGGRISVDSTPGRGARFTFTVPAAS